MRKKKQRNIINTEAEDIIDLAAIRDRKEESAHPFEAILKDLKRLISNTERKQQ